MRISVRVCVTVLPGILLACPACFECLLPLNIGADYNPTRSQVSGLPGATLFREEGLEDILWLEFERQRGSGTVGGYLAGHDTHDGGLVLLLNGASTFEPQGNPAAVLDYLQNFGLDLAEAGFLVWAPVLTECPTPYGGEDLADALEVVDWLAAGGEELLGVERVYVVGYSTGATVANLLNPRRDFTAVVSLSGIAQPDQFQAHYGFYRQLVAIYPRNAGFCQLAATLAAYGPPESPAWEALNAVDQVRDFRSPTLFMHGEADIVYLADNTRNLEARYRELRAQGATDLPRLEFEYIEGGSHFVYAEIPALRRRVVQYLKQFEPS